MAIAAPTYIKVQSKSILNKVEGMHFRWSINPYRGCAHGCQYCFARSTHFYLDLNAGSDFTSKIFVKVNAPSVLRQELFRPSWRREHVALGTATDPYQPVEGRYRLTRGILEALRDYRTPVSIVTKGTMVVRDLDVLTDMARHERATVCFSVTTLNRELWRKLEPGHCAAFATATVYGAAGRRRGEHWGVAGPHRAGADRQSRESGGRGAGRR